MRKQYHLRQSRFGVLAWDVDRLIELARELPVQAVPIETIPDLDDPYWFQDEQSPATCRAILEHMRLVEAADLAYPIILAADGGVMDGMHRVLKAALLGRETIDAVQFAEALEPDFIGVDPADLPYDRD